MSQYDPPQQEPHFPGPGNQPVAGMPGQPPYDQPGMGGPGEPPRTSGLAVTSLIMSLICCLPGVPLLGVLFGVWALLAMSSRPALQGKGLAIAGVILGLILTLGQGAIGVAIYGGYTQFRDMPAEVLEEAYAGRPTDFRRRFGQTGQQLSDAEAEAFVSELRDRYGDFIRSEMDFAEFQHMQQPQPGAAVVTYPYVLVFENAEVQAELTFDFEAGPGPDGNPTIKQLRIFDPNLGDLVFPPEDEDEPGNDEASPGEDSN